ncbi:hypothetical protein H4W80_002799 [Nonomuraea angiospora]|uniref:Histidine kinase n=1 Tax=Nonomuraea angiospora TaxID=46172 RepID=A0ABR9LV57_9ACTN|nr:hypothetical protein [Nonomuraea angiospora]MBE1584541.1 hypothetical protein [Nonomuraea angiospora]
MDTEPAQGQLRKLNLTMFLPLLAVAGAISVAVYARSWWEAVILGTGVVATMVCFTRWAAGEVLRVALSCLAVTYAQRRLNLSAELENARNLFEAAGIRVRVNREADVDQDASELLGQVLRETTTNILRHAQATRVRITLSARSITIVNDGAQRAPLPELRGAGRPAATRRRRWR